MLKSIQVPLRVNKRLRIRTDDRRQKQACVLSRYIDTTHDILEYGCGDGGLLSMLAGRVRAGIEPDPMLAQSATDKGLDVRTSVNAFDGQGFNRIIFSYEFSKLPNPTRDFAGLRPLLTGSGLLLLNQPIDTDLRNFRSPQVPTRPARLRETLTAAGYQIDDISVRRHCYRSTGYRFPDSEKLTSGSPKTYWTVHPFLSLVTVARKAST